MHPRLSVTTWSVLLVVLCLVTSTLAQDQKGTLVIALDTLGAQTMDPMGALCPRHAG